MPSSLSVLARARIVVARALAVAMFAGVVVLAQSSTASAAPAPVAPAPVAPTPGFASPFTCGQTWFARTYPGHPQYAVDWNLPGSPEADYGQPVFAGVAGVATVAVNAGYGLMVTIDHGDGWSTLYAHLSAAAVATGDHVQPLTLVGAVGRSGHADASHLHQEQQFNGVRQPIILDGHPVVATYDTRGAPYVSANCAPKVTVATSRWSMRWRAMWMGHAAARPLP